MTTENKTENDWDIIVTARVKKRYIVSAESVDDAKTLAQSKLELELGVCIDDSDIQFEQIPMECKQ